jgi:superfamily II DNA or RNA helicase
MFQHCPLCWYKSYVQKIKVFQDESAMNAGNCIHYSLNDYYSGKVKTIEELKAVFKKHWQKFKLNESKLSMDEDLYWGMVLNGINANKHLTSTELKIFYPEVVSYLDCVDTDNDVISDWKTSQRYPDNEVEYKQQLTLYAWMFKRKFGRIPKKLIVHYLRYSGSKGLLEFIPTEQDIIDIENWYNGILHKMHEIKESGVEPQGTCKFKFCPYLDICKDTGKEVFKIHVLGSYMKLEGQITEKLNDGLKKKFSYELKNAFWIKKNRPGADGMVRFWNRTRGTLPIGFLHGIIKTLNDYFEHMKVEGKIMVVDHRTFNNNKIDMPEKLIGKELRDYQISAVETAIKEKIGVLECCTGSGKTLMAAEIIKRLGWNTLFIVDKIELLRQTKKVFEDALGIEIGEIGAGEDNIKPVTVATMQTLHKNLAKYAAYLQTVRVMMADECHHCSAMTMRDLGINISNAEYRYGFSGTAFRDDKEDMKIYSVVGYIIHKISSEELIGKGWLVNPNVIFIKNYMDEERAKDLAESAKEGLINETDNYNDLYDVMITHNVDRNEAILRIVNQNLGKKILILVSRVEHGNLLQSLLPGSFYLHGSVGKTKRKDVFKQFYESKSFVLIGTLSIFAEGIDIPDLETIIIASAQAGSVKTIQSLGRVLRKFQGKTEATYYDFVDYSRFFKSASVKRMLALRDEGFNVKKVEYINVN